MVNYNDIVRIVSYYYELNTNFVCDKKKNHK